MKRRHVLGLPLIAAVPALPVVAQGKSSPAPSSQLPPTMELGPLTLSLDRSPFWQHEDGTRRYGWDHVMPKSPTVEAGLVVVSAYLNVNDPHQDSGDIESWEVSPEGIHTYRLLMAGRNHNKLAEIVVSDPQTKDFPPGTPLQQPREWCKVLPQDVLNRIDPQEGRQAQSERRLKELMKEVPNEGFTLGPATLRLPGLTFQEILGQTFKGWCHRPSSWSPSWDREDSTGRWEVCTSLIEHPTLGWVLLASMNRNRYHQDKGCRELVRSGVILTEHESAEQAAWSLLRYASHPALKRLTWGMRRHWEYITVPQKGVLGIPLV